MPRSVKTTSPKVASNAGRRPLIRGWEAIRASDASRFAEVEEIFLPAMAGFDGLVAGGLTSAGDRRNGKGDFLNDVLALLLERCSGQQLHSRRSIPGLLFRNHSLDIAWPAKGVVEVTLETKATGIPKHPGSPEQKESGRAGSADLEKRIKEAAFKDIDIKGEYARQLGRGGGATSDLTAWLRRTPPRNWLMLSVRVRDQADLAKTIDFAHIASQWFDGCGLFAYGHRGWELSAPYEPKGVPTTVELDRVMHTVCTVLGGRAG